MDIKATGIHSRANVSFWFCSDGSKVLPSFKWNCLIFQTPLKLLFFNGQRFYLWMRNILLKYFKRLSIGFKDIKIDTKLYEKYLKMGIRHLLLENNGSHECGWGNRGENLGYLVYNSKL